VLKRVAITFGSGSQQEFRAIVASDVEGVKCTQRANLQGRNSVSTIIDRTRRTGEVKHILDWTAVKRFVHIQPLKFKTAIARQVLEIRQTSGEQIVDRDNGVTVCEQGIAEMRPEKAGSSGHQSA
jgi:hypothetical protein